MPIASMLTCAKADCRFQDLVRQAEAELALVDLELIDDAEDAAFLGPDLMLPEQEQVLSVEMQLPPESDPEDPAGSSKLKRKLEAQDGGHISPRSETSGKEGQPLQLPVDTGDGTRQQRRNRRRRSNRKAQVPFTQSKRRALYRKAEAVALSLDPVSLLHSSQGYIGSTASSVVSPNDAQATPSLDPNSIFEGPLPSTVDYNSHSRVHNLVRSGYSLLPSAGGPTLFLDKESRIIGWRMGVVGGAGNEERWTRQNSDLTGALETLATHMDGRKRESPGVSRGEHSWAHWGYSYGGGERQPSSRQQTKRERDWWAEFLRHPAYLETTKSLDESWVTWAPKVHENYLQCHLNILQRHPSLDQVHMGSPDEAIPFASLTVNLGPQTVCKPHRDIKNKASGGICTIKTLGPYNWRLGGHIVLHELGLVVEMRPGDVMFFPSAVITHETIPLSPTEKRYSLVWYSAGGLFRWCDANFRSLRSWEKQDPQSYNAHQAEGDARWTGGWANFSTLADLISQT